MTDTDKWKKAFDSELRSRTYDRVIDLFSLRRAERFKVLNQLLPQPFDKEVRILELGTGTGVLTEFLMERYRKARLCSVDGAEKMLNQVKTKLFFKNNSERIELLHADYSTPEWMAGIDFHFDVIASFDSLHHLSHADYDPCRYSAGDRIRRCYDRVSICQFCDSFRRQIKLRSYLIWPDSKHIYCGE